MPPHSINQSGLHGFETFRVEPSCLGLLWALRFGLMSKRKKPIGP